MRHSRPAHTESPTRRPASVTARPEAFGPYLVFERIGVGGMASVHRAKKRGIEGFERVTALKRLLPHLAEDISFVRSFVREAKLASLLQHANIVQLHELGRVAETYFIAMEYVDGYDLRRLLKRARAVAGPPPPGVVVGILGAICDALDYAHNRRDDATGEPLGLVHRDVSPSNVIVSHGGHVKVLDFGIAKATSARFETQTGRVKGKLGYLSPEAVQGLALDARSDIFSAGVVAYELLTAAPLFASRNEFETLNKITRQVVGPPSRVNPAVPPELDHVVLKALCKDPSARFASAAAMREALDELAVARKLITNTRQVADWLAWAFSLDTDAEAPEPYREPGAPTPAAAVGGPLPVAEADDDVIEIAWGGRGPSTAPPVVAGVPDLSEQLPLPPSSDVDILGVGPTGPRLAKGTTPPPSMTARRRSTQSLPLMPLPEDAEIVGDASVDEDIPTDAIARIDPRVTRDDESDLDEPTAPTGPMVTFSDSDVFAPTATGVGATARRRAASAAAAPGASVPVNIARATTARVASPRATQRTWELPSVQGRKRRRPWLAVGGGLLLGAALVLGGLAVRGGDDMAAVAFELSPDGPQTRVTVGGQALFGHRATLAPGAYDVLITRRGFDDWTGRIAVTDGERHTVHVALRPSAARAPDGAAAADAADSADDGAQAPGAEAAAEAGPVRPGDVALEDLERVRGPRPFLRDDDRARARLCIDARGRVARVEVLAEPRRSSSRRFAKELRSWRFEPFEIDGVATDVCTVVTIRS